MRIRFFEPTDESETAQRLALERAVDDLWSSFPAGGVDRCEADATWLRRRVDSLCSTFALAPLRTFVRSAPDGVVEVVICCADGRAGAPAAEWFVERAPRRANYRFCSGRTPLPLSLSLSSVEAEHGIDLSSARARVGVGRGHLIDVVIASDRFGGADDERALDAAEDLVSYLLGDAAFDHWIGQVSVLSAVSSEKRRSLPVVAAGAQPLPLLMTALPGALDAAVRGVVGGLPDMAYHRFCERAEWVLFELDDLLDESEGGCGFGLSTCTTMLPEMLRTHLSGERFSSRRFSRMGEHFVYVELVARGAARSLLTLRDELEEAITRRLVPGGIGCVVGTGYGPERLVLYLALPDVERALPALRSVLASTPAQASLRFCDTAWATEWLCLGEGMPRPLEAP